MAGTVLFVSHEASRSGAPLLLLHLLRWLRANSTLQFCVALGRGGPLEPEFRALCPVVRINKRLPGLRTALRLAERAGPGGPVRALTRRIGGRFLRRHDVGLIYSNTLGNGWALRQFLPAGAALPVICHVHEMRFTALDVFGRAEVDSAVSHAGAFIAASDAVRRELIADYGVAEDRITTVHSFVPTTPAAPTPAGTGDAIRRQLGIAADAYVIAGCGSVTSGKGADLIPALMSLLTRRLAALNDPRPAHLVWVGGTPAEAAGLRREIDDDLRKLNLAGRVHFVGPQPRPRDFFAAADVFVLLSRSETLSLVLLEAAMERVPGVCFDATGGPREFVGVDAGVVTAYLDVGAAADAVAGLLRDPDRRRGLGERARAKVAEGFSVEVAGPAILRAVASAMAPAGR